MESVFSSPTCHTKKLGLPICCRKSDLQLSHLVSPLSLSLRLQAIDEINSFGCRYRLRRTSSWRIGDFSVYFPGWKSRLFQVRSGETGPVRGICARNQMGDIEREDFLFQTAVTH